MDAEKDVSGFSTIGILPNKKKREFVFLLFIGDETEIHYQEPPLEKYVDDINEMLTDNSLTYQMVNPFQTWKILYTCPKLEFNLSFKTRFPTYDFGRDSSASWHDHFEASGKVKGYIKFEDGSERNIQGFGQRDKSGGYRDTPVRQMVRNPHLIQRLGLRIPKRPPRKPSRPLRLHSHKEGKHTLIKS